LPPVLALCSLGSRGFLRVAAMLPQGSSQMVTLGVFMLSRQICTPDKLGLYLPEQYLQYVPPMLSMVSLLIVHWFSDPFITAPKAAKIGTYAPDFDVNFLDGEKIGMRKLWADKGCKPLFIQFVQNMCPGCGPVAAEVEALAKDPKYKDKVTFIIIDMKDEEDAREFKKAKKLKDGSPVMFGWGEPHIMYKIRYVPHMSIVDKDGNVFVNPIPRYQAIAPVLDVLLAGGKASDLPEPKDPKLKELEKKDPKMKTIETKKRK